MKNITTQLNLLKKNEIEKILNIKIKNKNIWLEAITHKSWLYLNPQIKINHNERLEFLGDAILQTITSWYLYRNFPELSEGEMSLIRAYLVSRQRLGEIAYKLGIGKFLLIGKILDKKGEKTVLGDSLEAIIGAIFIDSGFENVKLFIEKNILTEAPQIIKEKTYKDPKSFLQEILQAKYKKLPRYEIVSISGPAHKRKFKVEVYLNDQKIGEGEGDSKQKAEFNAALTVLKNFIYNNNKESR